MGPRATPKIGDGPRRGHRSDGRTSIYIRSNSTLEDGSRMSRALVNLGQHLGFVCFADGQQSRALAGEAINRPDPA